MLAGSVWSGIARADAATTSWLRGPVATGDWGGARTRLAEAGLDFEASYTTGFFANLSGGFEPGIRYDGFAEWGFALDFERLVRWPGASFRMNWISYHGGLPSVDLVGVFPSEAVNADESEARFRFFEIAFRQVLFEERLRIEIGQLTADEEFFQSDSSGLLANGTFGFLGIARSVTPFYPVAAPGVLVAARTLDGGLELRTALYTADVGLDTPESIGFDWGLRGGVSLFGELIWRPRVFGRAAKLAFGAVGVTLDEPDPSSLDEADSGYGLYGLIDVPIWASGSGPARVSAFSRSFGSPRVDRAAAHWYTSFGLAARGFLPARPDDAVAFGFSWMAFSEAYVEHQADLGRAVSDSESILELTYVARATGWMTVQPDLQVVLDPNFSRRNAVVLGLFAVVDF